MCKLTFNEVYNAITGDIPFNKEWNNGTGYFDRAVGIVGRTLLTGDMAKSISPDGRKIIFVGTPFGVVVVFQRYHNRDDAYMYNGSRVFASFGLISSGFLDEDEMCRLIGDPFNPMDTNIGKTLLKIHKSVDKVIAKDIVAA